MTVMISNTAIVARVRWHSVSDALHPRHKVLWTLLIAAALLVFGEMGLRVRAYYLDGSVGRESGLNEPDPLLGRHMRAGSSAVGARRSVSINRWGFRGEDIPKVKAPGVTRLAVLGNSNALGLAASNDEAVWAARMGSKLNAAFPTNRYDVINGGVAGYNLRNSIDQLTTRIAPFDPDIVVVCQIINDLTWHAQRQFGTRDRPTKKDSPVSRFAQKHSMLLHMVSVNTVAFKSMRVAEERHDRVDEQGITAYRVQMKELVEICRERGRVVVLCTCPRQFGDVTAPTDQHALAAQALAANPLLSLAGLNDAYGRYNEVIRQTARRTGNVLVDLDRIVPKRKDYFYDSVHLNDKGHRLVGDSVAEAISEHKLAFRKVRAVVDGL